MNSVKRIFEVEWSDDRVIVEPTIMAVRFGDGDEHMVEVTDITAEADALRQAQDELRLKARCWELQEWADAERIAVGLSGETGTWWASRTEPTIVDVWHQPTRLAALEAAKAKVNAEVGGGG